MFSLTIPHSSGRFRNHYIYVVNANNETMSSCYSPTGGGNGAPLERSNEGRQTRGITERSTGRLGHGMFEAINTRITFRCALRSWVSSLPVGVHEIQAFLWCCILQDFSAWPHFKYIMVSSLSPLTNRPTQHFPAKKRHCQTLK